MRRLLPLSLPVLLSLIAACGSPLDPGFPTGKPGSDGGIVFFPGDAGFPGPFCPKPDAGQPSTEPVIESSRMPAPISGGTLVISRDGHTAIAADPERDRVWAVNLATGTLVADVALQEGDEPGRILQDSAGLVHVALRRGGAVATIDLDSKTVIARRPVCGAPRGIAFDEGKNQLTVACSDGELVTLPSAGTGILRKVMLDPDLRDVTAQGDKLLITRFRSAEMLVVDGNGAVTRRVKPPTLNLGGGTDTFEPAVAWRATATPSGSVMVVHQSDFSGVVEAHCDGYGATSTRPGIVGSSLTFLSPDGQSTSVGVCLPPNTVLPVDVAVSRDGARAAIVAAGNRTVLVVPTTSTPSSAANTGSCQNAGSWQWLNTGPSEPTAVAFDASNRVVVLTREPALYINGAKLLSLPGENLEHSGHALFHRDAGKGLACASCHPEATHDGRTWSFAQVGPRRTQSLVGGILSTAPFHWDGDMANMNVLMGEVFVNRMGGSLPSAAQTTSLGKWLDAQPVPSAGPPPDLDAIGRGRALFNDPSVSCVSCHNGPRFSNNQSLDVGTGGVFQVPQLMGLALRAPYLHNGCAPTLRDRFGPCGGGDHHGHTSQLTATQLDDLVAYLQTL